MPTAFLLTFTYSGLALGLALAVWRGSAFDRRVLLAVAIDEVLSLVFLSVHPWVRIEGGVFLCDLVLLAYLLVLTCRAPKAYAILVTALQLTIVLIHLAQAWPITPIDAGAYGVGELVLTEAQVLVLATAMILTALRPQTVRSPTRSLS